MRTDKKTKFQFLTTLFVAALFAATLLPIASAQTGLVGSGAGALGGASQAVGHFAVAPTSTAGIADAHGSVTKTIISEFTSGASGQALIRDYSVLGTEVIESLKVDGFQTTRSLAGQGTAVLTLEGSNAVINAYDNINSLLVVQNRASGTLDVAVELAANVQARAESAQTASLAAANGLEGYFVIVNTAGGAATGSIDAAAVAQNRIEALLGAHEALVFRATPNYDVSGETRAKIEAVAEAVVHGMTAGLLDGEFTSEFKGAESLFAHASYDRAVRADTTSEIRGRVETVVRAASSFGADESRHYTFAYDLDYPDLPAQGEENVAVYVNGLLAGRASGANEVMAAAGAATYWAASVEGRTLVLVNTGASLVGSAQQTVTLVAVPDADVAARTLARLNAELGAYTQVAGEFRDYAEGKASGEVVGSFSSFFLSTVDGALENYALVEQGAEIFNEIEFVGQGSVDAAVNAAASSQYDIRGRVVELTAHDQIVASLVAHATAEAQGRYELAEGVQARVLSEEVIELTDGLDVLGHLVLVEDETVEAGGSSLRLQSATEVVAHLAAEARVVFRSVASAETEAQARLVAEALAKGELLSEVNLAVVGNLVAAADVDYTGSTDVTVTKAVRGEVLASVKGGAHAATRVGAFIVNSDRASLAAGDTSDIQVFVKNEAATQVRSAAEAYATATATGKAAFAVMTTAHGAHRIAVAAPYAAGAATDVAIKSTLEARNQAAAALDLFGRMRFDSTTGAATGAIVSFIAKSEASAVLDYTVTTQAATTTVFKAVVAGEGTFDTLSSVQAPSLRLVNPEATLEIFDTTSALMQITAAADTTASYSVAAGIEAVQRSDTLVLLNQASGGASSTIGALVLTKADGSAATSSALDASAAGQIHAQLEEGARLIFRAYSGFESELEDAEKEALANAIASGRVAGQVIYTTSAAASAGSTLTGHAGMSWVQGVNLVTQTASANEVTLLVDSAQNVGRTVILSLDPMTISGLMQGDAKLLVDGRAVSVAESYFDVLDPTNDAGVDEYYVHTTDAGNQVLVSLAHFSTRTITLHTPPPPSVFVYTTIGLGAVVVGQALYPWIRKRW